jgi:hypothetical protein
MFSSVIIIIIITINVDTMTAPDGSRAQAIQPVATSSCSPMKVSERRFGGIYRIHLKGRRIRPARNQREKECGKQRELCKIFDPEDGDAFLRNVG